MWYILVQYSVYSGQNLTLLLGDEDREHLIEQEFPLLSDFSAVYNSPSSCSY